MAAHLRSVLLRRTVLAGAVLTLATAGAGAAFVHVAAATPPPGNAAAPAPSALLKGARAHAHRPGGGHVLRALIRDTATQTGQTPAQVIAQLKAGKTLNQVAGGKAGVVKQDALAAAKVRLDRAVGAGRIDAAKEQALLSALSARLDTLMGKNLAGVLAHSGPAGAGPAPKPHPAGAPAQA